MKINKMKKYLPFKLSFYLAKEFFNSIILVFLVFLALSLLINFVEELSFLKEKKINNLIWVTSFLTLCKTPNTLIDLSIFIFLFSGIAFFIKIKKNNEINTILLSGISKILPILTPAIISFFAGLIIIFIISPVSSSASKLYEKNKRLYAVNENLIVINNNGLWFMETLENNFNIIRADTISNNNFSELKNFTIYNLDKDFNFLKRLDGKKAKIVNKDWLLEEVKILESNLNKNDKKNNNYQNNQINFTSTININELKEYFSNANTVSFWEIATSIKAFNSRGYSGDELKIKFHKYLSLPIYLFGMIMLSTMFTIYLNKDFNTLIYLFFGLVAGFVLYFLNDLSIAIGLSNKLPLIISVWSPVMIIIFLCVINLISINDK